MKGNFIIVTTARPSRQGAGCDHFIGDSKGTLKESSPCLLLLGEGAAAAADVEGTPKMLDRARFELSGVPSTPVPGCARSTLSKQERAFYGMILLFFKYRSSSENTQPQYFWM